MLNLDQYNSLPENGKTEVLKAYGVFLSTKLDGNTIISVYSLYDFFVETVSIDNNIIVIHSFLEAPILEDYLIS